MARKRNVFDIDFGAEDSSAEPAAETGTASDGSGAEPAPALETKSATGRPAPQERSERRGPMAAAITEASEATRSRAAAEAAIRAENDALAHEHVRLKRLGLITDLVDLDAVQCRKLTRDRSDARDADLDELKLSIAEIGLSNPIRVEPVADGYELIQGFRRLTAFRELWAETGEDRFARIPAVLVPRGEPLAALYRTMVDENLVRRDVTFGELAQLAISYARDAGMKPADAVSALYASALKQKRSYIRSFTRVLERAHGNIRHPEAIPRALGLDLARIIEAEPLLGDEMIRRLRAAPERGPDEEAAILKTFAGAAARLPQRRPRPKSTGKTSLRLARPEGEARVTAADGRVEMRLDRDFSTLNRDRLQRAVEAFFSVIDPTE